MLKSIKVSDYMTTRLVTLSPDIELNQAVKTLLSNKISGAPVVDSEGKLVGVFSESDCLRSVLESNYYHETTSLVRDHMTTTLETISADGDVLMAAEKFIKNRRRRLPVMKGEKIVGQISRRDVLKAIEDFNN